MFFDLYYFLELPQKIVIYYKKPVLRGYRKIFIRGDIIIRQIHKRISRLLARSRLEKANTAYGVFLMRENVCEKCPYLDGLGNCFYSKECKYKNKC